MEPTIALFTSKSTQLVELILMISNQSALKAVRGAHRGKDHSAEYWTSVSLEEVNSYLNSGFEVARFRWDSSDEGSTSDEEWGYADALAWEVPPVQLWAKGEVLDLAYVESIADYLGDGDEFQVGDILLEFPEFDFAKPSAAVKTGLDRNHRVCPWCGTIGMRAYNLGNLDIWTYVEQHMEYDEPVLWTDGVWSEAGVDPENATSTYSEQGESLISCPSCEAVFLASQIEASNPQFDYVPGSFETWVMPGHCDQGSFAEVQTEGKFISAKLGQTIKYLEASLSQSGLINWEQWTAAQQIVDWATYLVRTGEEISELDDRNGRSLLAQFLDRIGQIKEGTLGAMSPRYERNHDPDYFRHDFALYESIPLSNMTRIASTQESYLLASLNGSGLRSDFQKFLITQT